MSRSLKLYCDDILISCDKVLRYTQGLDDNSFFADELRFDAVIRNLLVIGEAVKQIPPEIRNKYPHFLTLSRIMLEYNLHLYLTDSFLYEIAKDISYLL